MAEVVIRVYNAKRIAKPGVSSPDWFDLDVNQDTSPLKLDISAIEIGEIGTNFGIGSQEFALPNTPVNNDFFNYAFDVNSEESGFTFQKSFPCQILVDGGSIASGKLYFDSVTTDHNGKYLYNCTFSDAVSSITEVYKDTLLADLDWTAYNHNFTVANVTGSWDELLFSGDIIYPNVLYGYPEGVNDWAWDANYFTPNLGDTYVTTNDVPLNAFKPAIRVKTIFDKIFDSINYEYESNFITNSTSSFGAGVTASFEDLYMLMTPNAELGPTIDSPVADAEHYRDATYNNTSLGTGAGQVTFDIRNTLNPGTEIFDPLGIINFASTNNITFPFAGNYRIEPSFTFQTSQTGNYKVYFRDATEGIDYLLLEGDLTGFTEYTHNQAIELEIDTAGTVRDFEYKVVKGSTGLAPTLYFKNNNFKIDNQVYDSGQVIMSSQFGNLKVADFLKGLNEQFNLVWWADKENPRKVYIEPWNDYITTGVELDWSDKVDYTVNWDISHPSADAEKELLFANAEDEDSPNKYYIVNDGVPFGSYTYQAQSDYSEGKRTIGKSFFAPTIVKPIIGTNAISAQSNMTIPHIYTEGNLPRPKLFKFKPRLLFKNGKQSYSYPYRITQNHTVNHYYQMSPATTLQWDAAKFDLNFSSYNWYWGADNVISYSHYTDNDSFNVFWANYINNIYRNPARKVTLNIKFEPVDLLTFRVNDLVFIDGQTYLINKISGFDLLKPASTQVELIKALYPVYNKPVFIVEGNDDIQVPGHGDPVDDNIGHEWVFEPDTGDPVRVVPTDITNGNTISVDSIKKTLIRQQGFLPSGSSTVWKNIKWDKQSLNTNIKNNLQYGINSPGVQSPNTITLGGKNDVNSVTSNVLVTGNTNTVSLSNKNLNVIGDNNNLELGNANLLYIGNNSNSGIRYFSSSLIMDITSGSNDLNKDSVYKVGIFALNKGVQLEGSHNGSVVISNVNSGSTVTSVGKTGYSVDNSFFMGNDDSNMSPNSSSIKNNFIANNTNVDLRFVTKSGVFVPSNITLFNNDGIVLSGSANSISAFGSDDATIWNSLNVMSINDTQLDVFDCADVTSMGATTVRMNSGVWVLSANDYNVCLQDQNNVGSIANQYMNAGVRAYNNNIPPLVVEYFNNFYATNLYIDISQSQESVYLNNRGEYNPGSGFGPQTLLVSDSNQSLYANNYITYISQSTETELIGNKYTTIGKANDSTFINNNGNSVDIGVTIRPLVTSSNQSTFINNSFGNRYTNVSQSVILNNYQILSSGSIVKSLIANNTETQVIGTIPTSFSGSHTYATFLGNTDIRVRNNTTNVLIATTEDCEFRGVLDNSAIINDVDSSYSGSTVTNLSVLGGLSNKITGSSNSAYLNNALITVRGGSSILASNNTFSTLASSTNAAYINNTTLNTSGSYTNVAYLNNFTFTTSGSNATKNTFINNSGSIIDIGSNNTVINARGSGYDIGSNKTMLGTNWLSGYQFWYSDYNLTEAAPAIIMGNSEATLYQNVPAQAHTSGGLYTGKQFHYGSQYHGYEYIVGTSGSTNTVRAVSNTILLDWFSTAGTSVVNLPLATDHDGMRIWFKATGNISATKIMRLTATGGERIDAGTTYDVKTGYQGMIIQAMDGQWWIMSEQ